MNILKNKFKSLLQTGKPLYGIFNGIPHSYAAEICAGAGFDWILLDAEHGPHDLRTILQQLQAAAVFDIPVLVRPPIGDAVIIKQLMDIGVQTLLIPMVETAEHAKKMVQAMRYPPEGIRGVGTGLARASQWTRVENYVRKANAEMCLIVQVESMKGLENLDEILGVKDLDAVLIGPSDLAASMGYLGEPTHPKVREVIRDTLKKIQNSGKTAGVMAVVPEIVADYVNHGARIIVVGVDATILAKATSEMAELYRGK